MNSLTFHCGGQVSAAVKCHTASVANGYTAGGASKYLAREQYTCAYPARNHPSTFCAVPLARGSVSNKFFRIHTAKFFESPTVQPTPGPLHANAEVNSRMSRVSILLFVAISYAPLVVGRRSVYKHDG